MHAVKEQCQFETPSEVHVDHFFQQREGKGCGEAPAGMMSTWCTRLLLTHSAHTSLCFSLQPAGCPSASFQKLNPARSTLSLAMKLKPASSLNSSLLY